MHLTKVTSSEYPVAQQTQKPQERFSLALRIKVFVISHFSNKSAHVRKLQELSCLYRLNSNSQDNDVQKYAYAKRQEIHKELRAFGVNMGPISRP